jgi:hypothetical protein
MSRFYLCLARTPLGGFHEWRPLYVVIHDRGVSIGWDRVEKIRLGQ